ncbi:MAG: Flp pilus assembly protein CpaB [Alphaproteobacteria bacterium]|nr:Flp pilus assembly protein CpaB [Alphaproteobacteria bacterium]
MNKNVLIVLAGAVLVAVLVAVMVQVMMGGKEEAVIQEARINVLVAVQDLKIGQELNDGDLRWQPWPKSSMFPGAVRQLDEQPASEALEGRLARNIAKGEPVMKSALLGQAKGNFVAASLAPGMRAMAIDVKAASMVSGFIGPGDFVDVILTYKVNVRSADDDPSVAKSLALSLDNTATETILQNVKILAVDQSAERATDDKIKVGKTVTLALSAQDAERLTLAADMGDLNLVLRGVGDDATLERKWPTVSDARLTSIKEEVYEEMDRARKESGATSNTVRIYSGNSVQAVPTR